MLRRPFKQVDVFSDQAFRGNPVAVVFDAEGLDDDQMRAIARWTNLSETVFVLPPRSARADYRLRIFTTLEELAFAGHPTLGACHAWLERGGVPAGDDVIQECGIGLVQIRRTDHGLAFLSPPLLRNEQVDHGTTQTMLEALGIGDAKVLGARFLDNGIPWPALWLAHAEDVLRAKPDYARLHGAHIGLFAPWPADGGGVPEYEARTFIGGDAMPEDPVTGSFIAGVATWLTREGLAPGRFVVNQGRVIGRSGRVHATMDKDGLWIGGHATTRVDGELRCA